MQKLIKLNPSPYINYGLVKQVDIDFLISIANKTPLQNTNKASGALAPVSDVFDEIERDGMNDPLVIVINVKRKSIRLESGNQRVREAKSRGYKTLPATVVAMPSPAMYISANGSHVYDGTDMVRWDRVGSYSHYPVPYNPRDVLNL